MSGMRHCARYRGEIPSARASVKALCPLRGAQKRAALTEASVAGSGAIVRRMFSSHVYKTHAEQLGLGCNEAVKLGPRSLR